MDHPDDLLICIPARTDGFDEQIVEAVFGEVFEIALKRFPQRDAVPQFDVDTIFAAQIACRVTHEERIGQVVAGDEIVRG
jgi:hypothetical protein